MVALRLVQPTDAHLATCIAALERDWSADNICSAVAGCEELARIGTDPAAFVASLKDATRRACR